MELQGENPASGSPRWKIYSVRLNKAPPILLKFGWVSMYGLRPSRNVSRKCDSIWILRHGNFDWNLPKWEEIASIYRHYVLQVHYFLSIWILLTSLKIGYLCQLVPPVRQPRPVAPRLAIAPEVSWSHSSLFRCMLVNRDTYCCPILYPLNEILQDDQIESGRYFVCISFSLWGAVVRQTN